MKTVIIKGVKIKRYQKYGEDYFNINIEGGIKSISVPEKDLF
jgi:hypothetical protein